MSYLEKIAPGLARLLSYQRSDLSRDIIAGLSVAAVALPVGVAYRPEDRKITIYPDLREAIRAYESAEPLLASTK